MADPHLPYPCEMANSVAVFRELSWLTRRKAVGLRLAHLPRLRTATGLDCLVDVSKLLPGYHVKCAGSFCTSRNW